MNTFTAFIMSGLGEGILACSPPSLDNKAPMAYTIIDKLLAKMDEHINNMVRRHNARANPDITPEILNKLVNGDVRLRAIAIAQVYHNAFHRMLTWDIDRIREYNRDSGTDMVSYRGRVRIYQMRSHKYKVLHQMLSPKFDPQDRVAIECIVTSEDET